MKNRDFFWVASAKEENNLILNDLNGKLSQFYSEFSTRTQYNKMIEESKDDETLDDVSNSFFEWFNKQKFNNILEVGCGTGRIRKHFPEKDALNYTGVEVSEEVIANNKMRWPNSKWFYKGVYDLDFPIESFDLVYSFYVLEHLVFPKTALEKMFALTKKGGFMVIICPDFVETKRLPSQYIGISFLRSAKEKLKKYKFFDAIISFYDSRIRLQRGLYNLRNEIGSFVINANPVCLFLPKNINIWPDCDAVYMSSKAEIEHWGLSKNLVISYPFGKNGIFKEHIFMVLQKK